MPRGLVIVAVVTLAGCATPQEQAARQEAFQRNYWNSIAEQCQRMGFQPNTDPARQCALSLHTQVQASQAQNAQPQYQAPRRPRYQPPLTTQCSTYAGQTTCRTQ